MCVCVCVCVNLNIWPDTDGSDLVSQTLHHMTRCHVLCSWIVIMTHQVRPDSKKFR